MITLLTISLIIILLAGIGALLGKNNFGESVRSGCGCVLKVILVIIIIALIVIAIVLSV